MIKSTPISFGFVCLLAVGLSYYLVKGSYQGKLAESDRIAQQWKNDRDYWKGRADQLQGLPSKPATVASPRPQSQISPKSSKTPVVPAPSSSLPSGPPQVGQKPQPPQTQTCVGSNCVQGTNLGSQTINNYGPPKLVMTDAQRDLITAAMGGYAGTKITIYLNNETDSTRLYGGKLAEALQAAHIEVDGPHPAFRGGAPSGVAFEIGENREDEARALGTAMLNAGLLRSPINAVRADKPDALRIDITPNE